MNKEFAIQWGIVTIFLFLTLCVCVGILVGFVALWARFQNIIFGIMIVALFLMFSFMITLNVREEIFRKKRVDRLIRK